MLPTLRGRIQTRLFLLIFIGVPWTLIITPFLPIPGDLSLGEMYRVTFTSLLLVAVLGTILWEPLYHLLQQFRWELDWPILFALLVAIPESILIYFIHPDDPPAGAFFLHFYMTWFLMWLFAIGPIKVVLIRWRYRGGSILW